MTKLTHNWTVKMVMNACNHHHHHHQCLVYLFAENTARKIKWQQGTKACRKL